ncbi:hypothetical protein L2E82_30791 [Cichorium intybus]|uniref:Uncharacterized protein n=1 Tax=Cichorium intybus TaxID=13427 RepID=A0ACB9D172_CICIN|nr:hypothetical protein L2E82_30791 [Cichorium intybus]
MVDVASRSTVALQTSIKEIVSSGLRALVRSDKNFYETHHISDDTSIEPTNESEYVITPSQKQAGRKKVNSIHVILCFPYSVNFYNFLLTGQLWLIEKSLGKFVDERKAGLLRDKGLQLEGSVVVAGRTNKGVTDG